MYFRLILISVIVTMTILFSGCTGAREPEEVGYVIAIGIDKAEQPGKIQVSYQLATPRGGAGGEGSISGKSQVISINTIAIAEGFNLLTSLIAPAPTQYHIKVLIIGEELARQGIMDNFGAAQRFSEYRGSMFVMVIRGTAKDFLEKNKPIFDLSPSKYWEVVLASGETSGYYLPTSMHEFYTRMKSNSAQPYTVLAGINPKSGAGKEKEIQIPGENKEKYIAGDVPREGGNTVEYLGTAVFNGDKMVGTLSNTETRLLAILLGKFSHSFLSMKDPLLLDSKSRIGVALRVGSKPKVNAELVDGVAVINVNVLLEGEITSIASGINYEEKSYLSLLEEQISQIFEEDMANFIRHTQDMNADVVGFGYYMHPCFRTFSEYDDYKWLQKYNQAQIKINVKTKLRRTGLILRSYPSQ